MERWRFLGKYVCERIYLKPINLLKRQPVPQLTAEILTPVVYLPDGIGNGGSSSTVDFRRAVFLTKTDSPEKFPPGYLSFFLGGKP